MESSGPARRSRTRCWTAPRNGYDAKRVRHPSTRTRPRAAATRRSRVAGRGLLPRMATIRPTVRRGRARGARPNVPASDAGPVVAHGRVPDESTGAQRAVLRAAAKTTLSPENHDLFLVLMAFVDSAEKRRNDLAHGEWGYSRLLPDSLVFTPRRASRAFAVAATKAHGDPAYFTSQIDIQERVMMLEYCESDFTSLISDIQRVHAYLLRFWFPAHRTDSSTAQERRLLADVPELCERLSLLRARRENARPTPPKAPRESRRK